MSERPANGPMKAFISQPMKDKTEEQIKEERERAIEALKEKCGGNVEILDSYFEDYNPQTGCIPLKFLGKSIEVLADANVAYFTKGWDKARGCIIEHWCALSYNIHIIEE